QRTIISTLKDIAAVVREKDIKPPAVTVIGNVVNLRNELNWYEKKPMFGQRILVTREHSDGFESLEELGAEILQFPTIEIVPPETWKELDSAIADIHTYDWLIFTSTNGVKYFFSRLFEKGVDIRELKGLKICAIGTKTASAINRFGIRVDLVPEEFRAEGLIEAFIKEGRKRKTEGEKVDSEPLKGMKFLLPRAEKAREILPDSMRKLGGAIDLPVVYRAIRPDYHGKRLKRFLKEGRITVATFTSAATFTNFRDIMGEDADELLKNVAIAVIGPVTAKAVEKAGLTVHIMPKAATIESMVEEITKWVLHKR
ncbi:MAG TPA: uroporphyrinogen-III synthase, partial [Thermodesulfovibrionales bacterium]|nr:uroporphyrinogen-III synthase [Thermodesulfovibrionales bacterium]